MNPCCSYLEPNIQQSPESSVIYTVNWLWRGLPDGVTVASQTFTPAGPTDYTISNTSIAADGQQTLFELTGGIPGTWYAITNKVTLSDGEVLNTTLIYQCVFKKFWINFKNGARLFDMAGDLEIGQLQEGMKNLTASISEIKDYLGHGIDRHTEVMGKLAVISSKQDDFSHYQKTCDAERTSIEKRLDANGFPTPEQIMMGTPTFSDRVEGLETFQKNQMKAAGAAGAIMAFLAYGGTKFAEKVIGWFS